MFKKLTLIFASLLFTSVSFANSFSFSPALSHTSRDSKETGSDLKTSITNIDLRVGYTFDFNLYVGGMYSLVSAKEGANSDVSEFYFGPTAGYIYNNFYAFLTYIVVTEQDVTGNNAAKYSGGNGFQLEVGYNVKVTDLFYLGPMLSYRSVNWNDKQISGFGQANFGGKDMTSLTPYVVFWFEFGES